MRGLLALLIGAFAASGHAQESGATAQTDEKKGEVVNLDTVRVTAPKLETLDLYRFRNPIDARSTVFERGYREPPSMEEIGMQGGIIALGINYGLMKAAEQVTKLPGWKDQIQSATARPPPLTEEQMQRAEQASEKPADPR